MTAADPPPSAGADAHAAARADLPPEPTRRGVAVWVLGSAVAFALDGPYGLVAPFLVAVLVLGRFARVWIGRAGVAALVAVPVSIVVAGIPTRAGVSPRFVNRSAWPTHLAFGGLALVIASALIDLRPALGRGAADRPARLDDRRREPALALGVGVRRAIVAAACIGLAVATVAVVA